MIFRERHLTFVDERRFFFFFSYFRGDFIPEGNVEFVPKKLNRLIVLMNPLESLPGWDPIHLEPFSSGKFSDTGDYQTSIKGLGTTDTHGKRFFDEHHFHRAEYVGKRMITFFPSEKRTCPRMDHVTYLHPSPWFKCPRFLENPWFVSLNFITISITSRP